MKVLYIHQYFHPPTKPGAIRSYEMAQALIRHGHQVTMLCGDCEVELPETNKKGVTRGMIDGIDTIQIRTRYANTMNLTKRIRSFVSFSLRCIRYVLKEDYDLLFTTSTPLTAGIPGIVMKLCRKKKFVFEVRDLWPELPRALGMKNPLWLWTMGLIEWLSYHSADGCIGLSPGICEGIRRRSQKEKPIEMVPNGCDLDIFSPQMKGKMPLDGIQEGDKVAIYAGTHGIANGLDAVLDAAKIIKTEGRNDIKFVFLGGGKMKSHLMKRVQDECLDNCFFYTRIPKLQIARIIASATLGMMVLKNVPAFYYGTSPNKFFDYIASGLPVINNYPGWLADMITKYKLGVVVEPDNPQAFAEGIITMADNQEMLRECGQNARAFAEMAFDRKELGDKFVAFLKKVNDGVK